MAAKRQPRGRAGKAQAEAPAPQAAPSTTDDLPNHLTILTTVALAVAAILMIMEMGKLGE